mmetsp:Transcript_49373/g.138878  ORF Transcript_49373/g.138878 Transcript_49373/m.138878 type:complete len:396 (-) Transcript_49373:74-1261(-)
MLLPGDEFDGPPQGASSEMAKPLGGPPNGDSSIDGPFPAEAEAEEDGEGYISLEQQASRNMPPIRLGLGLGLGLGIDHSSQQLRDVSMEMTPIQTPLTLGDIPVTRSNTPMPSGEGVLFGRPMLCARPDIGPEDEAELDRQQTPLKLTYIETPMNLGGIYEQEVEHMLPPPPMHSMAALGWGCRSLDATRSDEPHFMSTGPAPWLQPQHSWPQEQMRQPAHELMQGSLYTLPVRYPFQQMLRSSTDAQCGYVYPAAANGVMPAMARPQMRTQGHLAPSYHLQEAPPLTDALAPQPFSSPEPASSSVACGGLVSVGSVGHPDWCAPPCKYAFRRGCKDGTQCARCHLCRWSREAEKTAKLRAEAGISAESHAPGGSSEAARGSSLRAEIWRRPAPA